MTIVDMKYRAWTGGGFRRCRVLPGAGVSALPEGDPALGQVVGCQLHGHGVASKDPDVVLAHFPGNVGYDFMPVFKLYPELGVGEGFDNRALHFDAFFFRHKACP